jgi:hypothetical protein
MNKHFDIRYINGKMVKSRKNYSNLYVYFSTDYTDGILDKLKELYLYFDIVDAVVYNNQIEIRFYIPMSYKFIAFIYKYLKENNINNFKIGKHYLNMKKVILTSDNMKSFLKNTNYMF